MNRKHLFSEPVFALIPRNRKRNEARSQGILSCRDLSSLAVAARSPWYSKFQSLLIKSHKYYVAQCWISQRLSHTSAHDE